MRFERGKDIKETMKVGREGNPIKVKRLQITSPYKGKGYMQHAFPVYGDYGKAILQACKNSIPDIRTEMNTESGPYEISVIPEDGEDRLNEYGTPIGELREEYIQFEDEIYPILFPVKIDISIKLDLDDNKI